VHSQHVVTYSLNKGIKKFGEKAKEAAIKEMQQMIDRECFEPVHQEELKEIEKQHAMKSLIFLSEKKDGSLKAWHCVNGSTQRSYMQLEEKSQVQP
jgi:hypothetical protein